MTITRPTPSTDPAHYASQCFMCEAVNTDDTHSAISSGWGFAPVLGLAACPLHSISTHQVGLTRICRSPVMALELIAR